MIKSIVYKRMQIHYKLILKEQELNILLLEQLMNKQINDFQSKISKEQSKLVDDDLKKIRDLIINLNISLPQIQNSIDR